MTPADDLARLRELALASLHDNWYEDESQVALVHHLRTTMGDQAVDTALTDLRLATKAPW
jgi:hypothetical protein